MSSSLALAQMQTPAQFAVNQTGAATYTVPIRIPPGVARLEPKLALGYNSQMGNGLLGLGWSLSGLSSITVCPQTVAQDGANAYHQKTFYTTTDSGSATARFCLDGQRLVAVPLPALTGLEAGAAGVIGADQTYYRTELESFSLVQSIGIANKLPIYFSLKNRQGQTLEYGNTIDSKVSNPSGSIREWRLNKLTDQSGNYMTILYGSPDSASGQSYPVSIKYTANDGASLPAVNEIQFNYYLGNDGKTVRSDHVFAHYPGGTVSLTALMAGVTVKSNGVVVRQYSFTYDQGPYTGNSRIKQILECGSDLGTCMPPISFIWNKEDAAPNISSAVVDDLFPGGQGSIAATDQWVIPYSGGRDNGIYRIYNNAGYGAVEEYTMSSAASKVVLTTKAGLAKAPYTLMDVNGDGLIDLVESNTYFINVWLNGGGTTGFKPAITGYYPSDAPYLPTLSSSAIPAITPGMGGGFVLVGAIPSENALSAVVFSGQTDGTFKLSSVQHSDQVNSGNNVRDNMFIAPFNGDGTSDMLQVVPRLNGLEPRIVDLSDKCQTANTVCNLPNSVVAPILPDSRAAQSIYDDGGERLLIGDATGDGVPDIIKLLNEKGQLNVDVMVNDGAGHFSQSNWAKHIASISASDQFLIADTNGDGRVDIIHIYPSGTGASMLSIDEILSNGANFSQVLNVCNGCDSFNPNGGPVFWGVKDEGYVNGLIVPYKIFANAKGQATGHVYRNGYPSGDRVTSIPSAHIQNIVYGGSNPSFATGWVLSPPLRLGALGVQTVKSYTESDGAGRSRNFVYSYDSPAIDAGNGRGYMGFRLVEEGYLSSDGLTFFNTATTYRQDFPFTGQISSVDRVKIESSPLSRMEVVLGRKNYSYQCIDFIHAAASSCSVGPNKHYYIYPSEIRNTENTDLGPYMTKGIGLPGQDVTQTYDNWGNLTQSVTTVLDSSGAATDFSKTISNVYAPAQAGNWRFNKLLRSTVTATGH